MGVYRGPAKAPLETISLRIKRFENHEIIHINRWLTKRSLPEITSADTPEIGYMAYFDDQPISAAFLRKCEGNYAIMDSLITDPEADPVLRHIAIDKITENIIRAAKEAEFKSLLCFSVDTSTIIRAKRLGFIETNHVAMSRGL